MDFSTKYEGPHNDAVNVISLPGGAWRYKRPVTMIEKCCHCGLCSLVCPTGCIEDKGNYFMSNLESCKGCGTCAAECPVDGIYMVREEGACDG